MPHTDWIKAGYARRDSPSYDEDRQSSIAWQPDVYGDAGRLALTLMARTIVDIGCGEGTKLAALAGSCRTIGIDFGPNVVTARAHHPKLDWREHDLMTGEDLPLSPEELAGAILVCADVIEHVIDPHRILSKLAGILPGASGMLISTPERELWHGVRHMGPPTNPHHVREWSIREFDAILAEAGFAHRSLGLTRSNDHTDEPFTILALIAPSSSALTRALPVLIDTEPAPIKRAAWRQRISRAVRILTSG